MRKAGGDFESGSVLISGVGVLMATVLVLITMLSMHPLQQARDEARREHDAYLETALRSVETWYWESASRVDGSDAAVAPEEIRTRALSPARFNVQLAVSDRLGLPCSVEISVLVCVPYRRIALWIPASDEPSTVSFDPSTGVLSNGNALHWAVFDGRQVQIAIAHASWRALDRIAASLQKYAAAQSALQPVGNARRNFLRTEACSTPGFNEIECVDPFTNIDDLGVHALLGLSSAELRSAWQTPIQFSNRQASSTPPFSAVLRTQAPWGAAIQITAVQPI